MVRTERLKSWLTYFLPGRVFDPNTKSLEPYASICRWYLSRPYRPLMFFPRFDRAGHLELLRINQTTNNPPPPDSKAVLFRTGFYTCLATEGLLSGSAGLSDLVQILASEPGRFFVGWLVLRGSRCPDSVRSGKEHQ